MTGEQLEQLRDALTREVFACGAHFGLPALTRCAIATRVMVAAERAISEAERDAQTEARA